MIRLQHRADFLRAAKAAYAARTGVVVQARLRDDDSADVRVGFTATKKIGNAVVRNRVKRRLREAARSLLPDLGRPGHDYVFIARAGTFERPWQALLDDVKAALIRLGANKPARTEP
ncbi:ribonuclease P protein component [Asticcacaulis biprosthecium C19]|uniref:Ribonuclease P protein component n=1 Tax=Asticcacaulis biprosthecium C19 TaxID=715226 RepID=F4QIZ9_9CAUL|nr:ribonuclease P protein component [Asticcacaulis biprosthecium]EGF93062.1 ribonuclease P protein component [Asticcacaulis biprosthecium C19]